MKKVVIAVSAVVIAILSYANWPERPISDGARADRIVVAKRAHSLTLLKDGHVLKTYRIALGPEPTGHKEREGDNRTPEGVYTIDRHNPTSSFHLALHVSYPNDRDRIHAARLRVSPGGDIMIHGLPNAVGWLGRLQRQHDWTAGCIAMTNPEIEEIYRAVPDGTSIEIRP